MGKWKERYLRLEKEYNELKEQCISEKEKEILKLTQQWQFMNMPPFISYYPNVTDNSILNSRANSRWV